MKKLPLNITDQELCDLFREAVENYHPSYDQESWDKLSGKMERFKRAGLFYRHKKKIIGTILLLLLPLLLIQYPNFPGAEKNTGPLTKTEKYRAARPASGPLTTRASGSHPRSNGHLTGLAESDGKNLGTDHPGTLKKGPGGPSAPEKELPGSKTLRQTSLPDIGNPKMEAVDSVRWGPPEADLHPGKQTNKWGLATNPDSPANPRTKNPRWNISLAIGPDWGTVRFKQWTKPGIDAGVFAGYRLSERWSVTTGILLSTQIYVSAPGDYHPKVDNWSTVNLQQINADCRIIDVPVDVRYDLYEQRGTRIFASTGLSSFWMKKENYVYQYNISGNIQKQSSVYRNQNRNLFSVWNLSAGYETRINAHFSLQAAPFLKLPLRGIGYGRVRLSSAGLLISAKYHF